MTSLQRNEHLSSLRYRSNQRTKFHKQKISDNELKQVGYTINNEGRHLCGSLWSAKNDRAITFRLAYEFAYCLRLEEDDSVLAYFMEALTIPYTHNGVGHKYIPDLFVVYKDQSSLLVEIKPKSMIRSPIVQAKAVAATNYIKKSGVKNCKYAFITEEEIFDSQAQYRRFIEALRDEG